MIPAEYCMPVKLKLLIASLFLTTSLQAEPFTIGVSAPLTGELAEYGEAVRNGFLLSSTEHADSPLRFIFEDNKYDAKESLSSYRSLVTIQGVDLLFSWGETPLHAIAPLVERAGMPTVAMSVDAGPAQGKNSIIIAVNAPRQFAETVIADLRSRELKKICFVATEDPFLFALIDQFKLSISSDESINVVATVPPQDRDFRSLVTKLKGTSACEALGVYLLSGQVGVFYRELAKQGLSLHTFGTDVFESREEIKAAGRAMHGAVYPNLYVPSEFRERYQSSFAKDSQISYAYNAYAVGNWFQSLFAHTSDLPKAEILALLRNGPVTHPLARTRNELQVTHLSFPLTLRQVTHDAFEDVYREDPTTARARAKLP
jgi:ABC-type branched-subunit amino acid transport system substrate-binding protein